MLSYAAFIIAFGRYSTGDGGRFAGKENAKSVLLEISKQHEEPVRRENKFIKVKQKDQALGMVGMGI